MAWLELLPTLLGLAAGIAAFLVARRRRPVSSWEMDGGDSGGDE